MATIDIPLLDSNTVDSFYNSAVFHPESTWINELLDKVLPLSLLDLSPEQSYIDNINKAIYSLLSAKNSSWESFTSSVQQYNNSVTCGLVWTKNYYAYRCRTCAVSQCMSLCEDCFKAGDHEGHDFNLFRSSSGGACDCGDSDVMRETGFCHRHGERNAAKMPSAPDELVATARAVVPRLLVLLVMHFRTNYADTDACVESADWLFAILKDLAGLGAAMLAVMSAAVTDERLYADTFVNWRSSGRRRVYAAAENQAAFCGLAEAYETALSQLPSVIPEDGAFQLDGVTINERLTHRTILDELTFWMAQARFPQPLIGLLLAMLPSRGYKTPFAAAFSRHYLRMVQVLCTSGRPAIGSHSANSYQANLSYRVVHISVQLLSASGLCQRMCAEQALLERVLVGLDYVLAASSADNIAADGYCLPGGLVDVPSPCRVDHPIMIEHRYWPVVSDLVNMLVHRPVAMRLLGSEALMRHYTGLLSRLHMANANERSTRIAVEADLSKVYYSAFAADNEVSACTLWTLWTWCCEDPSLALRVTRLACQAAGRLDNRYDADRLSFHLPLHRMVSAFLCALTPSASWQTLSKSQVAELLNPLDAFLYPPLRTLIGYCEVNSDTWLRNGLQMKGQAMTYVHTTFCCSLVDLDLNLVQLALGAAPDKAEAVRRLFNLMHLDEYLQLRSALGDNEFIGQSRDLFRLPENSYPGVHIH